MKKIILIASLFLASIAYGQVTKKPLIKEIANQSIEILEVKITKKRTVITFKHTNSHAHYGFVRIMSDAYIQINGKGKKLFLLEAQGVPFYPDMFNYEKKGDTKVFKLYFPPIPQRTKSIDMIEIEEESQSEYKDSSGGFNFKQIWLMPVA